MIDIKPKSVLEQPIYMLTKATHCPYLDGKVEKRIATDITHNEDIHDELALNGFRRVENWMYRPVCDNCSACKSYRVIIDKFEVTKSLKRIHKKLSEVDFKIIENKATREHYDLFKKYQFERHNGGSMADMDEDDFVSMIETSPIETFLMEFRDKYNKLVGVILLDVNDTTLSAVYSFFEPNFKQIGLGNFMISQCLIYGKKNNFKYLYLGYYISQITSMAYKIRFKPGQILDNNEWVDL